jgi:hypothetical protein
LQVRQQFARVPAMGWLIAGAATAKFSLHLLTAANPYGYFCDELYSLALSRHLDFGYVDVPPLMPAILAVNRALLGESLLAIHILPALVGALTVVLVCLIARELGGGLFAVGLSALAFMVAPFWLIQNSFFGYDTFDQAFLAGFLYLLVRLLRTENRRLWLALGLVAGLACLTKTTILFLGPGFALALLVSKRRVDLLTPWPYLGGLIFAVVVSPYVIWELENGIPTVEYWAGYDKTLLYSYSPQQLLINVSYAMNYAVAPLLVAGLARLLWPIGTTSYRFLLVMFAVTVGLIFYLHGKSFMLLELLMPVVAAGAVAVERLLSGARFPRWKLGARVALVPYLLGAGLLIAPAALPVLPVDMEKKYADTYGFLYRPFKNSTLVQGEFPEELADRLGWEELVQTVAGVYNGVDPEVRSRCGIYAADWYGPAGAIDLYGPKYGLPQAISPFLTYYRWGPGGYDGTCLIVVGWNPQILNYFSQVELKGLVISDYGDYGLSYNTGVPIYVCRDMRVPMHFVWPTLKNYYD